MRISMRREKKVLLCASAVGSYPTFYDRNIFYNIHRTIHKHFLVIPSCLLVWFIKNMSASLLWNFISRTENCLGCWIFFPFPLGLPHLIPQTGENNIRWNDYNKNWWDAHMKIFFSPYPGDKWARSKGCWFEIPLTENFTQNEASVCCGMKSILNNKNNMTKIGQGQGKELLENFGNKLYIDRH